MQENFDLKFLKPIKGKHAISEVIFSVYLASPIIAPSRYEALVKSDGALSKLSFQNFKVLTGMKLQMKLSPNEEQLSETGFSKTGADGFNIEKYTDGKLSWVVSYQPSEPTILGQDILKIHCLHYEGWSSFYTDVVTLLKEISSFEDLFVRGYSLYYLDQFSWTQKALPAMSNVFKTGNLYLSNLFLEATGVWNFASNTNRTIGGKLYTENINIGINQVEESNYLIYVFHNSITIIDEFKSLKQLTDDKDLKTYADEMHTLNKDFLGQTLTDDVQILIGLKK